MLEHAHRVGPDGNRGADFEKLRCLFEDFGLKSRLLQGECGSQAADAAADDRDPDHSAEIATKSTKGTKNFSKISMGAVCASLCLAFRERLDVQQHSCVDAVDDVVRPH